MDLLFPIDVDRDEKVRRLQNLSQTGKDAFTAEISYYLFLLRLSQSRGRSSLMTAYHGPQLSIFWHEFPGGVSECVIYARTSLRAEHEGVFYARYWPTAEGGCRSRTLWQTLESYPWQEDLEALVQPYLAMGYAGFLAWYTGEPLDTIQAMLAEGDAFRKRQEIE